MIFAGIVFNSYVNIYLRVTRTDYCIYVAPRYQVGSMVCDGVSRHGGADLNNVQRSERLKCKDNKMAS